VINNNLSDSSRIKRLTILTRVVELPEGRLNESLWD